MTTIFLTGAGGSGTIEIIRTLKATGRYRVIAADASEYSYGLELADAGYVVPFATDAAFADMVAGIFDREKPDYAIPLVDEEILPIHRLAHERGIKVLAPRRDFCELALDKWRAVAALAKAGIGVPESWPGDVDPAAVVYPAIVKPRCGRGSRGLAYLEGADDLGTYLAAAPGRPEDYLVQRRVEGVEYTMSVVTGLDGSVLSVVPKEVLVKRGITLAGVTRHVPAAEAMGAAVQSRLRADGPFNVQFILEGGTDPKVLEVNPRYSTTVALTIAAGVHEVDLVVRHDQGEDVGAPVPFEPDLMMLRHYEHEYMRETEWEARTARFAPREPGDER